jgi:methionine--tRNA ligase beta chain
LPKKRLPRPKRPWDLSKMDMITYPDFAKVEFRAGKIITAENVEGSEKLLKLSVDFGELGTKIVFSGIRKWYEAENLVGKTYIFVVNLEPKKIMGEESQGMIIAAEEENGDCVLIAPEKEIAPGTKVY